MPERIRDLNTKAYYLLVALSFLYRMSQNSERLSIKVAITLTALVAVLPVQDYFNIERKLIVTFKIVGLSLALWCTIWWLWIPPARWWGVAAFIWGFVAHVLVAIRLIPKPQANPC